MTALSMQPTPVATSVTPLNTTAFVKGSSTRFDSVSLDEINQVASLMARRDRKYLVPSHLIGDVISGFDETTRVLEIDRRRVATYTTIYFDTPELTSFSDAAHKRRRRFKIRTRSYRDTATSFVELKTNSGPGFSTKTRTPFLSPRLDTLDGNTREFLHEHLAELGCDISLVSRLRPTLANSYRRTTFLLPHQGGRVTLDTGLGWTDMTTHVSTSVPNWVIVETKSCGQATTIDRHLWSMRIRPLSFSKYATCLATVRPSLPHNRWHRVIASIAA